MINRHMCLSLFTGWLHSEAVLMINRHMCLSLFTGWLHSEAVPQGAGGLLVSRGGFQRESYREW